MNDVREATEELLADKPEAESALEEILAVDEDGSWTFDDLSTDSGTFGEIVSRGIAEKDGDGYRVADQAAVRAILDGEVVEASEESTSGVDFSSLTSPDVDWQTILIVAGALAFVALVRIVFMWSSVFRGSDIVPASNDPYFYRYWVDTLLASDLQAFDFGSLTQLPESVANGDVLFIVSLWWAGSLLGGGQTASGLVVVWYPVVAAVVSAGLVYLLAVVVTRDRRVGFAAVLTLAVTPAHAFRSALGYGDHHAFDFVWLALVGLTLAILATDGSERGWYDWVKPLSAIGLGVGVAAQTAAWRGGPILLLPIAGYVVLKVVDDVRADRSPVAANQFLVLGLAVGGILTLFVYSVFGWMATYRGLAPALLAMGAIGAVGAGGGWVRLGRSARKLAAVEGGSLAAGAVVLWFGVPSLRPAIQTFQNFLTSQNNIAETQSLISGGLGSLLVFGLFLFLALPYLAVWTWRVYEECQTEWLAASVFAWYLLGLAIIKLRFAGELSVFVALFAGVGLVHIAEHVELARPDRAEVLRVPDGRSVAMLATLFLLFASLGAVQTPTKMSQITIDDETYETAVWIDEYAEQEGLEYPDNYVFSRWSKSRVYNYHVNGESRSYGFSRRNYRSFLSTTAPDGWARNQLNSTGFVVIEEAMSETSSKSDTDQVYQESGDVEFNAPGRSHYRVIRASSATSTTVFEVVPGAHLTGTTEANRTKNISTEVRIPDARFKYVRQVSNGAYNITVPYPGEYQINGQEVRVTEEDIRSGNRVSVSS